MDIATVSGLAFLLLMLLIALFTGQLTGVFLNVHGLLLVVGGTAAALLLNTPLDLLRDTGKAMFLVVRGPRERILDVVGALVAVSQAVHFRGINALKDVDPTVAGGFAARAAQIALEFNDPAHVTQVLENEINQTMDRDNEVVNVLRTMGVLSPMFGLVGTLVGIIDVLRQLANPEQVGPSMAMAITTAFYGILLANLVAVPIAGKLRIRFWEKYTAQRMIIEAITLIMQGTVPAVLERRLQAYLPEPGKTVAV